MTTITIDVPDELTAQIGQDKTRLSELVMQGLHWQPLLRQSYYHVLNFLTSRPTPIEIAAFRPTAEMIERRRMLVAREHTGEITPAEKAELDEYDCLEHAVVMLKTGNLPNLVNKP